MTDKLAASKFLSLLLRHKPEVIGLHLDDEGWAEIDELVRLTAASRTPLARDLIEDIVASSDKQRFKISPDGLRVRANQGHSIAVELGLAPQVPPEVLYHGTIAGFLESIYDQGLVKGSRQHVHLSADVETAQKVGQRRGKPVVLKIQAGEMNRTGHTFFRSDNGVWLVDTVPPEFLELLKSL